MKKSRVLTLGLACFFTAVTACSTLAATSGGGALYSHLNDASRNETASSQNFSQTDEKSAGNAQNGTLSLQEKLLAGTLELDPENDPVIGTTESGVEIRFHNKAFTGTWDYDAFTSNYISDKFTGSGNFNNLKGYLYVTMGTYNGSAVNWIIIGRNPDLNTIECTNTYAQSTETITNFLKFTSYSTYANELNNQMETTTPAGAAISAEISNRYVNTISGISRSYSHTLSSYGAPVASSAIPSNCVLCICSKALYNSTFNASTKTGNNYSGSNLQTQMTNLYSSGLGLTSAQKAQIQAQTLSTQYLGGTSSISSQYLFPLAGVSSSESYYVGTYLTSDTARDIDTSWWSRSGDASYKTRAYHVYTDGSVSNNNSVDKSFGVRPAFVLKI